MRCRSRPVQARSSPHRAWSAVEDALRASLMVLVAATLVGGPALAQTAAAPPAKPNVQALQAELEHDRVANNGKLPAPRRANPKTKAKPTP